MDTLRLGRLWHAVTAAVAWGALLLVLVLVIRGGAVLDEDTGPDPLGTRLMRFISFFTVASNIIVALTCTTLALGQNRYPTWWRVLRLNALVCIAVTGLVHWFLLRGLLEIDGLNLLGDRLMHIVVPLLTVIGWVAFGPRGRFDASLLLPSLIFPIGWLAYTLIRGAIVDWYPYPFLDVSEKGYPSVLAASVGVAALLLALTWLAIRLDPHLPGGRGDHEERRSASAR